MNRLIAYIEGLAELRGWPRLWRGAALVMLGVIPSVAISALVIGFFPSTRPTDSSFSITWLLFSTTAGALGETYLMRLVLFVLRKFVHGKVPLCVWVALIFGLLHASVGWGLFAVWPFFIMTVCYLRWEKNSLWQAMVGTALLHGAMNAFVGLLSLASLMLDS